MAKQVRVRGLAPDGHMRAGAQRHRRHLLLGACCAGAVALASPAASLAAGSGYAGGPAPQGGAAGIAPTGFSSVVVAKTLSTRGGTVLGSVSGGKLMLRVPKGAYGKDFQAAVTKGSKRAVKKDLPNALKRDAIIAGFAIELRHGSSSVRTSKPLTLTFKDRHIAKGDIVVVYHERTGRFEKVRAMVEKGKLVLRLKAGETIAILAPRHARRRPHGHGRRRPRSHGGHTSHKKRA